MRVPAAAPAIDRPGHPAGTIPERASGRAFHPVPDRRVRDDPFEVEVPTHGVSEHPERCARIVVRDPALRSGSKAG